MIRRAAPALCALGLAVVVLGPALAPGYVLQYDMVFVPRQWLLPASFGLGGQLPRAVPQDAVLGALTALLPGSFWQHLALLAIVVLGALGAVRLLRGQPALVRAAAAMLFVWSPYLAQRLMLGSWSLLLAVALLPWALQAAIDVRRGTEGAGWRLLLVVGLASLTPTGGLLAVGLAGPVALGPGCRRRVRDRVAIAMGLVALQLPWIVPSVVHPAAGASDPGGALAFALRPEGSWGALVTALGTGGVWNAEVVLPTRDLLLAPAAAVLLTVLAGAGLRPLVAILGRAAVLWLGICAVLGLAAAVLGSWSATQGLMESLVTAVPGAGLLRDGQKWLAPWLLLMSLAAPLGLQRAMRGIADRTVVTALGIGLVLLPVAVMPDLALGGLGRLRATDYPAGWAEVRTVLEREDAAPGDVAVLPWSAFRAFEWNRGRTSLDPAPRFLPRTTVVDDSLAVATPEGIVRVSGEDPRARRITAALDAGRPLVDVLPALGVSYVVVELTTPGPSVGSALDGLDPVLTTATIELYAVPGQVEPWPAPSGRQVVLVALAFLVAGLVMITTAAQTAVSSARGRRNRGRPATVPAVDESKEDT
ncbi:MAG: hypothetical protein AB7I24_15635 [Candidatus Nanopelagicales bacterium]